MPHLLPLDQGELVSCYVTPSRDVPTRSSSISSTTPTRASRSSSCATGPVGVIDVRDTNYCRHLVVQRSADGRGSIVFAAIDNLWKGAASQAVQNLNLMFGRPETEGLL